MQFRQYLRFLLFGNNYSIQPVLQKLIFFTIFLLVILWIVFAFYFKGSFCYSAFTITAVIGAYYFGGSAIGFIFAIPKSFQGKQTIATNETNGDVTYHFRDNTSLEEISDWITKIIIGLSLTQFNKIQDMLYQAARYISSALSDAAICSNGFCTIDFLPFSYGIILLYGLLGIMSGYLWTRIEFPKILIRRDKDMIRIQHEAFQNKVNDPNNELFGSIGLKTTEFATDGKKEIMERILGKVKPGPQADDPQKNRWGGKAEKTAGV